MHVSFPESPYDAIMHVVSHVSRSPCNAMMLSLKVKLLFQVALGCNDVLAQDAGHITLVMFGNHCDAPGWYILTQDERHVPEKFLSLLTGVW